MAGPTGGLVLGRASNSGTGGVYTASEITGSGIGVIDGVAGIDSSMSPKWEATDESRGSGGVTSG